MGFKTTNKLLVLVTFDGVSSLQTLRTLKKDVKMPIIGQSTLKERKL